MTPSTGPARRALQKPDELLGLFEQVSFVERLAFFRALGPPERPLSPSFSRRIASATKRHTASSPATRDETYGKGSRGIVPAMEGPNVRRVNPVGVGRSGGLRCPQVQTCGYSRLAPAEACHAPSDPPFQYPFLTSRIAAFGYKRSE